MAPGFIATDMTKDLAAEALLNAIPLGRYGEVDEVAGPCAFWLPIQPRPTSPARCCR